MSNTALVESQLDMLKILAKPNSRYRKTILAHADKNLVTAICQCIDNVLKGVIKIPDADKTRLKKFRMVLYELLEKSSLKQKKKILVQKGNNI
jgi:hypothetical protein